MMWTDRPQALALAALVTALAISVPAAAAACDLADHQQAWIQRALDGWAWILREPLARDPELPWMVLFDADCVWNLAAPPDAEPAGGRLATTLTFGDAPVPVTPHNGSVRLPNGTIPAAPMAASFLHKGSDGDVPFFALALVDLWREVSSEDEVELDAFFLGVAIHEMVHTLQLRDVNERVTRIRDRHPLPESLDDDLVQTTFSQNEAFSEGYLAERDLLVSRVTMSNATIS